MGQGRGCRYVGKGPLLLREVAQLPRQGEVLRASERADHGRFPKRTLGHGEQPQPDVVDAAI